MCIEASVQKTVKVLNHTQKIRNRGTPEFSI
jgi:hypothetical protein